MKIAIVGAEEKAWGVIARFKAQNTILNLLTELKPDILVSGHCPAGGVDIWAEGYAYLLGIQTEIYPPEINHWKDRKGKLGFESRNKLIAANFDNLYVISPVKNNVPLWNGGEWTAEYAEKSSYKDYKVRIITRVGINETGQITLDTKIIEPYHKRLAYLTGGEDIL